MSRLAEGRSAHAHVASLATIMEKAHDDIASGEPGASGLVALANLGWQVQHRGGRPWWQAAPSGLDQMAGMGGTTNQNQATSFCGKLVSATAVVVGGTAAVGFALKGGQELATMNSLAQDGAQNQE